MERVYNIPLRKGFSKSPKYKRAKKAVKTLKEFLMRHMKCSENELKLGKHLNRKLWERGIKNPPHHIKVTAVKEDSGIVKVELFGYKYEEKVVSVEKKEGEEEKKEEKDKVEKKEEKEDITEIEDENLEKEEKEKKEEKKEVKRVKKEKKKESKEKTKEKTKTTKKSEKPKK